MNDFDPVNTPPDSGVHHFPGDDGDDIVLTDEELLAFKVEAEFLCEDGGEPERRLWLQPGDGAGIHFLPVALKHLKKEMLWLHYWHGLNITCPQSTRKEFLMDGNFPCDICNSVSKAMEIDRALARKMTGRPYWDVPAVVIVQRRDGEAMRQVSPKVVNVRLNQRNRGYVLANSAPVYTFGRALDGNYGLVASKYAVEIFTSVAGQVEMLKNAWRAPRVRQMSETQLEELASMMLASKGLEPESGRVDKIRRIFGDVVLVPQYWGTKRPALAKWPEESFKRQGEPAFIKRLDSGNIAVQVGAISQNTCSIDIDDDEQIAPFIELNPWAKGATTSRGGRGCNIWFTVDGEYPHQMLRIVDTNRRDERRNFTHWGEFRGGDCLTTVSGLHKTGRHYQLEVKEFPTIRFADIRLPQGVKLSERLRKEPGEHNYEDADGSQLDLSKLKSVRRVEDGWIAQCPACHEDGHDNSSDHLKIYDTGQYCCIKHQGEHEHNKRIFALAKLDTCLEWFCRLYPRLVEKFGEPFKKRVDKTKTGIRLYYDHLNTDFFAALFGVDGTPKAPWVFNRTDGEFYRFTKEEGVYQTVAAVQLSASISELMLKCVRHCYTKGYDLTNLETCWRREKTLQDVVARARALLEVTDEFFTDENSELIACANGVLRLEDRHLLKFSPEFKFRLKLSVDYDADAEAPNFTRFLGDVLEAEDSQVLQRKFGQVLSGRNHAQKIVILKGEGGDGKGTLSRIVCGVLGHRRVAKIRVDKLDGRFELSSLRGKAMAFDGDVAHDFLSSKTSHILKSITGGDYQEFELKTVNERPAERELCINVFVCANNRLKVRLMEDMRAWRRRLVYLHTKDVERAESEVETDLSARILAEEGSGILNWMLTGLDALRANGWRFELTQRQQDMRDALLEESSSVRIFARECLACTELGNLSINEAFKHYLSFCGKRAWYPEGRKAFGGLIKDAVRMEHGLTTRNDLDDAGGVLEGWSGLQKV